MNKSEFKKVEEIFTQRNEVMTCKRRLLLERLPLSVILDLYRNGKLFRNETYIQLEAEAKEEYGKKTGGLKMNKVELDRVEDIFTQCNQVLTDRKSKEISNLSYNDVIYLYFTNHLFN
jgi:hypothetical protein